MRHLDRGADARGAVAEVIEAPDRSGRLRAIIDAAQSNRVRDDFSDRLSFAREDFERKLHRRRAKVAVTFVDIPDTLPVQGPETEVIGETVYSDFLAMLDPRDRRIVVLLNSGFTKLADIADELGYANHSAVSKRLARIRTTAERYFDTMR